VVVLDAVIIGGVGKAFTVTALVVAEQPLLAVNVNVALPAETPVMTPEVLLIVATAVLELIHVPPVEGLAGIVEPTQTELADILTVGKILLMVVAVELVALAAVQPAVLV
jgi:hypothetical protein